MKSRLTPEFVTRYRDVPPDVKRLARKNFKLWRTNPRHTGLQFKRVSRRLPFYSVRIGSDWRAVALLEDGVASWFWIGPHDEYDRLLAAL